VTDFEVLAHPLLVFFNLSHQRVFNKPVEKFVEKPTPGYGKVKTIKGF
jgi:hypothetical protein